MTTYWGVKYLIPLTVQLLLCFKKGELQISVVSAVQSQPSDNPMDSLTLHSQPLGSDAAYNPFSEGYRIVFKNKNMRLNDTHKAGLPLI